MRRFNTAGVCVKHMHYMVDISSKIDRIVKEYIEVGYYFTINRARQYGKTTTFLELENRLKKEYVVIKISFEGLGEKAFENEKEFSNSFIDLLAKRLEQNHISEEVIKEWEKDKAHLGKLEELSRKITWLVKSVDRDILLLIDEVDKSSNNQLFLHFIGMLRNKYLERNEGSDQTFKSVVLAGVHDVKNLKLRLRPDEERKYNSPWNIAVDFDIDLSFSAKEIESLLRDYESEHDSHMNIEEISEELYRYTSGYPFLVSKLCQLVEEKLDQNWTKEGLQEAVKRLLNEKNTLFDDLIKNLQNNEDLYSTVYEMVVEGQQKIYNVDAYEKGIMYGVFREGEHRKLVVHNKVFELRIYNYMMAKRAEEKGDPLKHDYRTNFIDESGDLKVETILEKFQLLMKQEYRDSDERFIEREGRLLFLCFVRPIINGAGFYYVEPETRQDNRMDVVITYNRKQYIIELKIWRGKVLEDKGLDQLANYLDVQHEDQGYMVIFNFNKSKEYTRQWIEQDGKKIYEVMV